ncbi:MAG: FAD binding domain-containing protein [Candidatus Eisenbacteria bacterium]
MRTALSTLEVVRPRTLDEALAALASEPRPTPLAGGTDLLVYLNAGTLDARRYLDLGGLPALRGIRAGRESVTLGALTTFSEIRAHPLLRRRLPALAAAAAEVGAWAIQNRATLGGNIANASPAGDSLPVLLAHEAIVHARSWHAERVIDYGALHTGYRTLALAPDELITAITVPFPPRDVTTFFRKVGTRRAQSISKVVFCGWLQLDAKGRVSESRLAYGSMAPVPVRATSAETAFAGRPPLEALADARAALERDLTPIDDVRSDREYRMTVAGRLLEQLVRNALALR